MTLDLQSIQNCSFKKIAHFRFKKLNPELYIITNDAGKFHYFDEMSFLQFINEDDIEKLPAYNELVSKGFIKNDAYENRMTGSVALKNHFLGYGPSLHMIVTTLRCNHKCKYCHAAVAPMTAKEFDMDKETATRVVDTIMHTNSDTLTIEFQGGESLVNYEIWGSVKLLYK